MLAMAKPLTGGNVRVNKALVGARRESEVHALIRQHGGMFNMVNCSTAFSRLGRLGSPATPKHEMFARLCSVTLPQVSGRHTMARHISGILWSLAKLEARPATFLDTFLDRAAQMKISLFQAQEVSMCLWALAKLNHRNDTFVRNLATAVEQKLAAFTSQGLSNVLYAFARLEDEERRSLCKDGLVAKLVDRICVIFASFNAQEVANSLSSLAKIGVLRGMGNEEEKYAEFQSIVLSVLRTRMSEFNPQNLANAMWSVAKYLDELALNGNSIGGHEAGWKFREIFQDAIFSRSHEFNGQELSMCIWAASVALRNEEDAVHVAAHLGQQVGLLRGELNGQQIVMLLTGLAKLQFREKSVMKGLAKQAEKHIKSFSIQDLDQCLGTFVRIDYRRPKLAKKVVQAATVLLTVNTARPQSIVAAAPQNVANLMWALAKLEYSPLPEEFATAVEGFVCQNIDRFKARDIANVAWAFAMLCIGRQAMKCIGDKAALQLDAFNAQECSKLLYAMEKSKSMTPSLKRAASESRVETYEFPSIRETVSLAHILGGGREFSAERESTGATAATGNALWEPSLALAEWMSRQREPSSSVAAAADFFAKQEGRNMDWGNWRGKVLVELGAGIGLCSIVAAKMGMKVVTTDGDIHVLDMLAQNVAANMVSDSVAVKKLSWGGKKLLKTIGMETRPDVVLASGCVYGKDIGVWKLLAKSLRKLSGPNTLILMSHGNGAAPGVQEGTGFFHGLMRKKFVCTILPASVLHPDRRGCCIHALWRK